MRRQRILPGVLGVGLVLVCSSNNLRAGEVVFDTAKDWAEWQSVKGTVEIAGDGWVRPTFIRKDVNAVLNTRDFGGEITVGSNTHMAENIADGNTDTWWSPSSQDPLQEWWIELNLGRLVTATRMVLKFVPERPFKEFEIYTSAGNDAIFYGSGRKDYKRVWSTTKPNEQEVIEYVFSPEATTIHAPDSPEVQFVYIRLTAASGNPALAELELYEIGDNIALGTLDRYGSFENLASTGVGVKIASSGSIISDGNYPSYWQAAADEYDWTKRGWIWVDLGALFWVDTIRHIWIETFAPGSVISYKMFVSDGSRKGGGAGGKLGPMKDLAWDEIGSLDKNPPPGYENRIFSFTDRFSIRPVRFIFFSHRQPIAGQSWELLAGSADTGIAELQVFGEGYVLGAVLTSPIIDLGRINLASSVEWEADTPPGTRMEIRTRTGDGIDERTHYYGRSGEEIDKKKHDLETKVFGESGPVVVEQIPDSTWSGWSDIYPYSGYRFLSPNPRRYLQVHVAFPSEDPLLAPSLDKLTLIYSSPLAKSLTGEISPGQVPAAQPQNFSYYILPNFDASSAGFDQLLIRTPSTPRLTKIEVGEEEVVPVRVSAGTDSLLVQLPSVLRSPVLVAVWFECMVFENGTPFEAFVANSTRPGDMWQRVDAGDVTELSSSNRIVVFVPVEDKVIGEVMVEPEIITPNGDGINDRLTMEFTISKIAAPRQIEIKIFSLSGKVIREFPLGLTESGRHQLEWNGADQSGKTVPPGLYIFHVQVDADAGREGISKLVSVAF